MSEFICECHKCVNDGAIGCPIVKLRQELETGKLEGAGEKASDNNAMLQPCKEHSPGQECIIDNQFKCHKCPCSINFSMATTVA
jgi:hypothetical protein